nr:GGDEF domain-containing phosphodiesterase [Campylobacter anatolicus]
MIKVFKRLTNNNTLSFLYTVALFTIYFIALYNQNEFYSSVISVAMNVSIATIIAYNVKDSKNLKHYWALIVTAIFTWAVADAFMLFYSLKGHNTEWMTYKRVVHIVYLLPYILFLIACIMMFIKSMRNRFWLQTFLDITVVVLLYLSFFWAVVFNHDISLAFSSMFFIHTIYIIIDVVMFCCVFIIYYSLHNIKRRLSFYFCLLAIGTLSIVNTYFNITSMHDQDIINTYFRLCFEIVFVIFLFSSFYIRYNEMFARFGKNSDDFHKILISKVVMALFLIIISIGAIGTLDVTWFMFVMMTILFYSILTYNISSIKNSKNLIEKDRQIRKKLDRVVNERMQELNQTNKRLKELSEYDFLTGLLNRSCFLDRLEEMIKTKGIGENICVYNIDLIHFKAINDTYGHYVGDEVLVTLTKNISEILPNGALFSRFDGDDLYIVVKSDKFEYFKELIVRIYSVIKALITIDEYKILLNAKIGFSITETSEILIDDLLAQASAALSVAKRDINSVWVFYDDVKDILQEQNHIEILLNSIDFDKEFELNFQPQFELNTQNLIGAEALLRWHSPIKGNVMPSKFIPIAEQSSIIINIDRWVAKQAIKQIGKWNKKYGTNLKISINVSLKQMDSIVFANEILNLMSAYDVNPSCVNIEISESSFVIADETLQKVASVFKQSGIGVSVDDFGASFSSFNYIKKYMITRLKISKELVDNIATSEFDKAVINMIISLTKTINIKTLAEGVESIIQLKILKDLGCDEIQGFIWGRAVNADEFEKLIINSISQR